MYILNSHDKAWKSYHSLNMSTNLHLTITRLKHKNLINELEFLSGCKILSRDDFGTGKLRRSLVPKSQQMWQVDHSENFKFIQINVKKNACFF